VKFSLISATSVFALLSAAVGPAHAAVLNVTPGPSNIYDLVHDGVTSSDGGDRTVPAQDPLLSAVTALEATNAGWRQVSSTGPVDPAPAASTVFPRVPLGAAPGTWPDDDFATPITGAWHWTSWQKALATGMARIAPLIGTIGDGPSSGDKPGSTVFVAEGSAASFNDRGAVGGARSASVTAFAPSSTSTATITVAGAGNFRPRAGSGFSVAAATSLRAMPAAGEPAPLSVAMAEAAQPTMGFHYAPAPNPATKPNAVEASFSGAATATGSFAQLNEPATSGKIQTGQLATGQGRPGKLQASDAAATYARLIDLTQPIDGKAGTTQVDGTRTFISASVSADPATTAALYMASVVHAAPVAPAGQTVEAFQIGPTPGARTQGGPGTTVADPLHGKIMASVGPLNNSLALP
jgi:hypothetical protein